MPAHYLPGLPTLMGSITQPGQVDLKAKLRERDEAHGVDHENKAKSRAAILGPGVHENADTWWKESRKQ